MSAGGQSQFLVLGHSLEKSVPFDDRPLIPPGTTLLILAECDVATRTADVDKAIKLASEIPLDFSKFRVYTEGTSYPPLTLQLLSDAGVETTKTKSYTPIVRSGVYAVPFNLEEFQSYEDFTSRYWHLNETTGNSTYSGYGKILRIPDSRKRFVTYRKSVLVNSENPEKDLIEFQFSDAIYPTKSQISDILQQSKTVDEIKSKLIISLEDLMKTLGPGIYIVPSCRTVQANAGEEEQDLFQFIEDEIDPELASTLSLRQNFNRLKYRKQKLNLLNRLKDHPKLQEQPWKETLAVVRNRLQKIITQIENTRSKSTLRQRNRGGKNLRKTRRTPRK